MLFNEPKLLKSIRNWSAWIGVEVSVLFNEPKLLKYYCASDNTNGVSHVSVLFNEPKLLKLKKSRSEPRWKRSFSALQRAEIAEINRGVFREREREQRFSALQRAEIAEIVHCVQRLLARCARFSALQRAEIAEIRNDGVRTVTIAT